jgi:hypothetical protein
MPEITAASEPVKLAGKYDTPEALNTGFKELHTKVYGEDAPVPTFADATATEKAYRALETVHGKLSAVPKVEPKAAPTPSVGSGDLTIGAPPEDDPDEDAILAKAGLNKDEVFKQYAEHRKLTDVQAAALKKVGYGPKMADRIARGIYAEKTLDLRVKEDHLIEGIKAAGGPEEFKNLNLWASVNLPEAEIADYNVILKSNPAAMPRIIKLIAASHAEAVGAGKAQPLVTGGGGGGPTGGTPRTLAEYTDLVRRAARGDAAAEAIVKRTRNVSALP